MARWNLRYHSNCPYCETPQEDTNHILLCAHTDSIAGWNEALKILFYKLYKIDTCWYVLTTIQHELNAWRHNMEPPDISAYPNQLQSAIQEQRRIGWKRFLEGMISKYWGLYMTNYYLQKNSRRLGQTWAMRLIQYTWDGLLHIWDCRNIQLHETERINDLEGLPLLKKAAEAEWKKGLGHLPASEFSHHLRLPLDQLLSKSPETLKTWVMIIKQARVMMDPKNIVHDEFKSSKALQKWIDVDYSLKDDEALPTLTSAVSTEWCTGQGNLPSQYTQLFQGTLESLLKSDLVLLKQWLTTIRTGRLSYDTSNLIMDDFSYPGAFKDWVTKLE